MRRSPSPRGLFLLVLAAAAPLSWSCGGETPSTESVETEPVVEPAEPLAPVGPLPALVMVQAHFKVEGGKPIPQPAKMVIYRFDGENWADETVLDADSNVFHKVLPYQDGLLTIGAEGALLKHWTRTDGEWTGETLWQREWGGDFDRLRDLEIADVDGDGEDEMILATHDKGVVAVGNPTEDGWSFAEFGEKLDTFVHEIETGDVDGDGTLEFYATPSDRNRASMTSQPGGVVRYAFNGTTYEATPVVHWEESHAKEILVDDLGTGRDMLFAAREAHTEKKGDSVEIIDPVRIVRFDPQPDGTWSETVVATLEDRQCRFLLAGDVDGDGTIEMVAAGMKSGLWVLEPKDDGTFDKVLVDAATGGFEHATHIADLDGDGKVEIYVASDDQKALGRYTWNGERYEREEIAKIPSLHITWNLATGTL